MPTKNLPKREKKKVWKAFALAEYQAVVEKLVHFSTKTTNSNTPAFGIRLGTSERVNLPYAAASTMDISSIPGDYEKNSGQVATVLAQISAILESRLEDFEAVPVSDVATIQSTLSTLASRYETTSNSVGMRLRQVIVQDELGGDIVLSPLQSAGFSALLVQRLEEEQLPVGMARRRGFLGVGGANPQNVGRHVRSMNRPLWFSAPVEDARIRAALAVHHRGISLSIPRLSLVGLYEWRRGLIDIHGGSFPDSLETRLIEAQKLKAIVDAVLDRAAKAGALLEANRQFLPGAGLTSSELGDIQRGLVDVSARTHGWAREFAQEMHGRLIGARFYVKSERRSLGVGSTETVHWISIIEGCI